MTLRVLLMGGVWLGLAAVAGAQTETTLTGVVSAVETKGKTTKLTISADGVDHVFELLPKVELQIVSAGDDACLVPGLFVQVDSIQSNNYFFGTTFTIYPDRVGKPQPASARKIEEAGQSMNRYFVTGEIAKFTLKPDVKYDSLELKGVGKNTLSVYVERKRKVRVVQADPKFIEAGQSVSVTGRRAGAKLVPTLVTVETGRELKGEEFVPTLKLKKR